MKRFFVIFLVLIVSLIIGILAILTAIKLTTEKSVSPNAPQVKPRAEGITPTIPPSACTVTFTLNPTPTGPTAVPSPTTTLTPAPNVPPTCTGLSASPTSGDAPLNVTFVASGFDDNAGYIAGFQFTFGDGQTKKIEQTFKTTDTYTISHSYSTPGSYVASVSIEDNNGSWSSIPDSCKQTITVTGGGLSATPQPSVTTFIPSSTPPPIGGLATPSATVAVAVPQIPTAGNILPAIVTISGGAILLLLGWVIL